MPPLPDRRDLPADRHWRVLHNRLVASPQLRPVWRTSKARLGRQHWVANEIMPDF